MVFYWMYITIWRCTVMVFFFPFLSWEGIKSVILIENSKCQKKHFNLFWPLPPPPPSPLLFFSTSPSSPPFPHLREWYKGGCYFLCKLLSLYEGCINILSNSMQSLFNKPHNVGLFSLKRLQIIFSQLIYTKKGKIYKSES